MSQSFATNATMHSSLRRSVANTIKGSAGNLVEWYDVYAYSVFAVYFENQFFSEDDKNSTIYIWAIFAVTFLMRPVGSWFFGRFADRHGRRLALTVSVAIMCACSFVIAITPTAATIGAWAAVILILARLLQGFATGGEYGTSATYMSEAALVERRGFLASFQYVTLVGGHVLAQLTLFLMLLFASPEWIGEWGWRIAFAIGGLAAVVVFWLRRTMDESLTDEALDDVKKGGNRSSGSLGELFRHYWKETLICFLLTAGGTILFYAYSVNGPNIVKNNFADDDKLTATVINLIALIILMLLQPVGGWLSDKVGRKTLLTFFGIGGLLYTWVFFTYLPQQESPIAAFGMLVVAFVILTGYTSVNAPVKAALFPTHIRALGVGLGYALANSAFGGTAPLLYTAAKEGDWVPGFIVYMLVVVAISTLVYIFLLANRGKAPNWLDDPEEMLALKEREEHGQKVSHRIGV